MKVTFILGTRSEMIQLAPVIQSGLSARVPERLDAEPTLRGTDWIVVQGDPDLRPGSGRRQ